MSQRPIVRKDRSRASTIAARSTFGALVVAGALMVACGGQAPSRPTQGGGAPLSGAPKAAPTARPLPTFGRGEDVSLNVADDLAVPIPASWENRTADTDFASANGLPSDVKTELLIQGPGGGNGVTVPVLYVVQEPGSAIDANEFPRDLMHNGGGFGSFLIRSTGDLSVDGSYAYQVIVTATNPDGRAFEEWDVLVNHVGKDGKQHTYNIGFISSPDAFNTLFPMAQNVIGGLTWF